MADDSDQWTCPSCTLMNTLTAEVCEACGVTSPLVLESYEAEERLSASGSSSPSSQGTKTKPTRGIAQDSMASDALSEEIASEMDPWTQAELEWAHVEAHQESTTPKKRK